MRYFLLLASLSLQGATYYVSSAGNDANSGTIGSPWLTFNHAAQSIATGDTIIIVANGNKVTCDATLPTNITNIKVQSSALASLPAIGYRVNPAVDSANFGKCQFSGSGIIASGEVYGHNQGQTYQQASVNLTTNTFTITGHGWTENGYTVANGTQIEPELYVVFGAGGSMPTTTAVPAPLTILNHYYIVNCAPTGPSCGSSGSTFQLAATPGGAVIDITACDMDCSDHATFGLPVQADTSADTITATQSLSGTYGNGLAITFASGSIRLPSSLPAPLTQDTIYYVCNLSGRSFKLGTTAGCGTSIDITNVGTGMQSFSNQLVPHGWKFSGIEFAPTSGNRMASLVQVGNGSETSILSMPDNFEFDRDWFHDFSATDNGPIRGIVDNSTNLYVHDSWFDGIKDASAESQCITGQSSVGPTRIINNFLECMTENVMYGGGIPNYYPVTNQDKTITGNYFYKPFLWKYINGGFGTPSGTCLYDTSSSPDPRHRGGEYLFDATGMQGWVCVAGTWTMTGSTPFFGTVKNVLEFKSGRRWTVSGNVLEGSWTAGQAGQVFTFGQQDDSGPGTSNDHITVTNNKISKSYRFMTWGSHCTGGAGVGNNPCVNGQINNLSFTNNLYVGGGPGYCGVAFTSVGCGYAISSSGQSGAGESLFTWNHNTTLEPDGYSATNPYFARFFTHELASYNPELHTLSTFTNSIDSYDLDQGITAFASKWTSSTWNRMVIIQGGFTYTPPSSAGSSNTMTMTSIPASTTAVGFVNAGAGDYHLSSSSPYSAANGSATMLSSDGTDLGADIDAINLATSGAIIGAPPWNIRENFTISVNSTSAVATYTRPGSSPCNLTLYNAPARITVNENADTSSSIRKIDTRTGNVIIGSNVTFNLGFNNSLTPSTTYWYSLSCIASDSSIWLLAGDSFTTLSGVPNVGHFVTGQFVGSGRLIFK